MMDVYIPTTALRV